MSVEAPWLRLLAEGWAEESKRHLRWLLTSRPVADAIIQKFGLAEVYHAKDMTEARKKLAGYTEVTSEKNGFIAVSVTDKDKKRVAEMANAYTDELRILTKTLAVTEASQRRLFYEEQLKQAKEALVAAELAFQQVQQQKGLVQLDAQAKAMIEGLAAPSRTGRSQASRGAGAALLFDGAKSRRAIGGEGNWPRFRPRKARLEQSNHSPGIAGLGLGNVPAAGLEYLRASHELQYQQALYDMLMKQYDAAKLDEVKRGSHYSGRGTGHRAGQEIVSKTRRAGADFCIRRSIGRMSCCDSSVADRGCTIRPDCSQAT